MAKEGQGGIGPMTAAVRRAAAAGPAQHWNPPFCGDLDMRIAADGTWYYQGSPIGRAELVKLFASVLRREGDKYYLVTPVEKCGIAVDDAPFVAVALSLVPGCGGRVLRFRTNVDDWVECGPAHPLRFAQQRRTMGLVPYLHVRDGLWAKLTRALLFDLAELGEERQVDGRAMFGVASNGAFFAMAAADELRDDDLRDEG